MDHIFHIDHGSSWKNSGRIHVQECNNCAAVKITQIVDVLVIKRRNEWAVESKETIVEPPAGSCLEK